ncbi:hypothetical protein J6590_047650 [Homalodisca vitripennis]|nr:hypothetical protein J6590_047650 [Homalodisca vitripennis]
MSRLSLQVRLREECPDTAGTGTMQISRPWRQFSNGTLHQAEALVTASNCLHLTFDSLIMTS